MGDTNLSMLSTIESVAPADWDALCGTRPFVNHRWLRFVERALVNHQPRYVVLRRAGRLEAAAVCSVERRFDNPTLQQRAGWLLRRLPCVRCGVPIASETGLVFRPGADDARLAPVLLDGVRQLAARERALFTTVGHLSRSSATWQPLQTAGCTELSQWSNTILDIEWSSFDDYLASRPRDDRHDIGRMRRRAEREDITVDDRPVLERDLPHLWKLVRYVQERHSAPDLYTADILEQARDVLAEDLHVLVARRFGDVIGCVVLVRSQDELLAKWIGLDYERTWNTATYYMLLAESVRLSIRLGVRRLRLGATAYATKQHFGVVTEERVNALVDPTPLRLLGKLAGAA
jgi:predicted N-acyltransferase